MHVSTPPAPDPVTTDLPGASSAAFRPAIVAPTYNNARTLTDVLNRCINAAPGLPLFVVNDGSTDGTAELLRAFAAAHPEVSVLTHEVNRGKAAALHTAFLAARQAGCTHVVTVDTDGQLDPEQIPELLEPARNHLTALVIGNRDDRAADYPSRSRLGRRISNFLIRVESGVRIEDSQCGFRVYPLGLVKTVHAKAGRYGFEAEIITRAGWAGCPVLHVPVRCRYQEGGERVTHFRPVLDSLRGARMHLRLLGRALLPWPYRKWPPKAKRPADDRPLWRRLLQWISPIEAWKQLRRDQVGRTELAAGLAAGAFIANLPLYPIQTLFSVYAAKKLHLHPLTVVAGSQLSTPPIGPLLVLGGIIVGHIALHGKWPTPEQYQFHWNFEGFHQLFRHMFFEWLLGGVILGAACAAVTFVVANLLFKVFSSTGSKAVANTPSA
jgi:glycosyltransferase involved in cell wall biosynthesis